MIQQLSLRTVAFVALTSLFSHSAIASNSDLTEAEANTIVKEDIASAQVMAEVCPTAIGKNDKLDGIVKGLIQSYLGEYSDKATTLETLQSDAEYKSILDEARKVAKETNVAEQKEVCTELLSYEG